MTTVTSDLGSLDKRAEQQIKAYLHQVWHPEWLLSEEDVLAASHHADRLYLDTDIDLSAAAISDRTLDIAFRVRSEMIQEFYDTGGN